MKRTLVVLLASSLLDTATAGPVAREAIPNWSAAPFWSPPPDRSSTALATEAISTSPLPFTAIAPCRIVDTRGGAPLGGGVGPFTSGQTRSYDLNSAGAPCDTIPANAGAYSVNVTVTDDTGNGFVAIYPTGNPPSPMVSLLNYKANTAVANATIVPCDANGSVTVLNQGASANVLIDINGYYAPANTVSTLNALTGDVVLAPGSNVSITPSGPGTLTIASTAGGTITGVNAGLGLNGGGTSGNVTLYAEVPFSLVATLDSAIIAAHNDGSGAGMVGFSEAYAGVEGTGGLTGTTYGVRGISGSATGYGVFGSGQMGVSGVSGFSSFPYTYVGAAGVWGNSDDGVGVYGTSDVNAGVVGVSHDASGVYGASTYGYAVYCNGNGGYTGTWGAVSDARLKKDVETLGGALERVRNLRGVSFRWRVEDFPGINLAESPQIGFIAQEVERVVPEVVTTGPDGLLAIDYAKLAPLLVEAIKAQQAEIEALGAELDDLRRARK